MFSSNQKLEFSGCISHKDELKHYDNRGIEIPEPPEGIVYKYLGVQDIAYNQPKSLPYATENPWA